MRVVKAAAVQLSPVLYSREATVDKIVRKITELGQPGAIVAIDRTPAAHVHGPTVDGLFGADHASGVSGVLAS